MEMGWGVLGMDGHGPTPDLQEPKASVGCTGAGGHPTEFVPGIGEPGGLEKLRRAGIPGRNRTYVEEDQRGGYRKPRDDALYRAGLGERTPGVRRRKGGQDIAGLL